MRNKDPAIVQLTAPFRLDTLDDKGSLAGYASIFSIVDEQNDCVEPGAFKESLEKMERVNRLPKMLWQHNTDEPMGVWHFIEEDKRGLYVEGQLLLDIQKARDVYALVKSGAIDGLSIGYRVVEARLEANSNVRHITKVDLLEVSIVTFAANHGAKITNVKVLPED